VTPEERQAAILAVIAAELEDAIAGQHLKRSAVVRNANTLRNVLKGRDHRISTLVEVADGVNLDVEIVFRKRSA